MCCLFGCLSVRMVSGGRGLLIVNYTKLSKSIYVWEHNELCYILTRDLMALFL